MHFGVDLVELLVTALRESLHSRNCCNETREVSEGYDADFDSWAEATESRICAVDLSRRLKIFLYYRSLDC